MAKDDLTELKTVLETKNIVIGAENVLKKIKHGEIKDVFICSNISKSVLDDLNKYSKLAKLNLRQLPQTNEELGVVCKKPFMVSIIGILK